MGEWNVGKQQKSGLKKASETAILVGVIRDGDSVEMVEEYLTELEFLAETAGAKTVLKVTQRLSKLNSATFIGSGKLQEIQSYIENNDVDLVVFDDDLTPKQTNIIEKELKRKIVDRSSLILDIFASRAQTAQARTQVELAQMQYLLPRLRGLWTHLERQKGGIGMRGPGEQEIETDRRIVRDKISKLKKDLGKIDRQSQTQRKNRGELIRVALVGYTNAGKSTLMNVLSRADLFAENKLFATLDTTVRKVVIGRMPFLLSDTVGFIRKLPHHLVESFKSTLDEVRESDLLIHLVDLSHVAYEDHIATVNQTIKELGADKIPTVLVFNKLDLYRARYFDDLLDDQTKKEILDGIRDNIAKQYNLEVLFISSKDHENVDGLKEFVGNKINELYEIRYPYRAKFW
ncbi:MAG: GTP-binding protein HflX [Saprospiraceae bacterium]|jgi:GTP-binding protein HflX